MKRSERINIEDLWRQEHSTKNGGSDDGCKRLASNSAMQSDYFSKTRRLENVSFHKQCHMLSTPSMQCIVLSRLECEASPSNVACGMLTLHKHKLCATLVPAQGGQQVELVIFFWIRSCTLKNSYEVSLTTVHEVSMRQFPIPYHAQKEKALQDTKC